MSTMVVLPPIEYDTARLPLAVNAPRRESGASKPAWKPVALVAGLGLLALASAMGAVWQAEQAAAARSSRSAGGVWTDARITTLGSQSMRLGAEQGREWALGLDFNYTSVFRRDGGVLNITHLRQGQQVKVLSSLQGGRTMAKAIEIKPLRALSAAN